MLYRLKSFVIFDKLRASFQLTAFENSLDEVPETSFFLRFSYLFLFLEVDAWG
jgi:hypothetical protein